MSDHHGHNHAHGHVHTNNKKVLLISFYYNRFIYDYRNYRWLFR
ncbi:Uncharacterised protein [Staphylococcus gallinarum]|uniref:Uncharacterized protein n=1 Tax=Staphylococcus gallinarum TaxID=1293 RepID=A0A380FJA7_STAGA|nr:Uncharacterised protein [Staphylococcus gallinarum]